MTDEVNAGQLRAIIERIEAIEAERSSLAADVKEIFAEARGNGFDAKIIRKIVAMRKLDADKRREEAEILKIYLDALGMIADLPLGAAAVRREFGERVSAGHAA